MTKKIDATRGPIIKLIFLYTIPLILSTILQNFFSIADQAVLGNMAGTADIAAIGATGNVTNLIINGALGLSTGTAIILARYVGQKNEEKIRQTIDTSLIASIVLGAMVGIVGIILTPTFLDLTNCPAECYDGAVIYMRIYLAATPATLFYNYGSAILRTLGDTQRPLAYISIAGVVNVVLNIILCFLLREKVAAVAIATVASNIVSSALILNRLCHFEGAVKIRLSRMQFKFETLGQILRFGIPTTISQLLLPISNLQITSAINTFGVDAVAGISAAASVHSIVQPFSGGFATATTTFIGQNLGAKNTERVKKSFWYLLGFSVLIAGTLGILVTVMGKTLLGIIIGTSSEAAIEYGMIRMYFVTQFMFVNATNGILTHALQAFGYPIFTSISDIAFTLGFRTVWMQLIYPHFPTIDMVMRCFTISWILNMILYAVFFAFVYRRYTKTGICKKI